MDIRFKHPFTCMVNGPTKAGKTTFVKNLIANKHKLIVPVPTKIWWCCSEPYDIIPGVTYIQGIPDLSLIQKRQPEPQLIVLDDMMVEMKNEPGLVQLFTRGSHHWNVSVIHIVHNLFYDKMRTPRINSDYIVLMKNPADHLQALVLARHLFPTNQKYFMAAHDDATRAPHGYLLIDLTQYTDDKHRLRTNIFSPTPTIYLPKL